jgi:hypothetical protein
MQDARDSKPGTGAKNLTKVVDGKTYVLYAGRWHVKVENPQETKS